MYVRKLGSCTQLNYFFVTWEKITVSILSGKTYIEIFIINYPYYTQYFGSSVFSTAHPQKRSDNKSVNFKY